MAKYKYDPTRVRVEFRRKYCKELQLPSGKMSGYELFPITEQEINELLKDFDGTPPHNDEQVTISEWMLWAALRLKYGINYLSPMSKQHRYLLLSCPTSYQRTAEESAKAELDRRFEELECRMQNYVDNEMEYFNEEFLDKINEGQKTSVKTMAYIEEDFRKYFKKNLDNVEF